MLVDECPVSSRDLRTSAAVATALLVMLDMLFADFSLERSR